MKEHAWGKQKIDEKGEGVSVSFSSRKPFGSKFLEVSLWKRYCLFSKPRRTRYESVIVRAIARNGHVVTS